VVDVEVVVLDVREDHAGERDAVVEPLAQLARDQLAMLGGDALPLGERGLVRT
jgi:hypothetical protein